MYDKNEGLFQLLLLMIYIEHRMISWPSGKDIEFEVSELSSNLVDTCFCPFFRNPCLKDGQIGRVRRFNKKTHRISTGLAGSYVKTI